MELSTAVVETHVSRLLFVGDRVLKWYRPLATGFLDHSTVERRHRSIRRELELNRRYAPDVYLDVVSVVGSDGAELEPALLMRRLPDERRLTALLGTPEAVDALRDVARVLVVAHERADRGPEVRRWGTPDAVRQMWDTNLDELDAVGDGVLREGSVGRARDLLHRWLDGRAGLLEDRLAGGHVVDGHGDLLCDDIFVLDDGPRILDCLAFRDDFRCADVVADLAFLAMDLDRLGQPDLVDPLVAAYAELSGHPVPASLLHAWRSHRALVRAKVACIRHAQGDPTAANEARSLMALAIEQGSLAWPVVVLVGGPPGTGKTTVAEGLGAAMGATVLHSDEVRKELAGLDRTADGRSTPGAGIYDDGHTDATYAELWRRAAVVAGAGEPVVLDASWAERRRREALRRAARDAAVRLVELCCEAPPSVAAARIEARRAAGGDASDATAEVADWMRARFDPWPEAVVIDGSRPADDAVAQAVAVLRWA